MRLRAAVLTVRIHFPPGKSPVRTSSNQLRNQISADDPSAGSSVYLKAKVVDGRAGRLVLMGVARKVMLGKNWPIRALVRVAPGSRYQPSEFERRRAQAYRGRDIECAVFFECCLAVVRRSNQHLLDCARTLISNAVVGEILADPQTRCLAERSGRAYSPILARARPLFRTETADDLDDRPACRANPTGLVPRTIRRLVEGLAAIWICCASRENCCRRDIPKDTAVLVAYCAGYLRSRRGAENVPPAHSGQVTVNRNRRHWMRL